MFGNLNNMKDFIWMYMYWYMTWYILYMYQKYEMVYTLVYVYILINEISLTGLLFWNIIVHVIVNVQFMAERERENLDFKKKSYCYISFTYLSVIVFLNMFYGASKYSSRWGNLDVILILFHLMICMNFFFRTCIVNGYIFFNHCFFGFNLSIPSMVSVLYFI